MKLPLILLALSLVACSKPIQPTSKPQPTQTTIITRANCEVLRVSLPDGTYSAVFGGAAGVFVPAQGLNIMAQTSQLECRRDGVFKPY